MGRSRHRKGPRNHRQDFRRGPTRPMVQQQTEGGYDKDAKARASVLRHLLPGLVSEVLDETPVRPVRVVPCSHRRASPDGPVEGEAP